MRKTVIIGIILAGTLLSMRAQEIKVAFHTPSIQRFDAYLSCIPVDESLMFIKKEKTGFDLELRPVSDLNTNNRKSIHSNKKKKDEQALSNEFYPHKLVLINNMLYMVCSAMSESKKAIRFAIQQVSAQGDLIGKEVEIGSISLPAFGMPKTIFIESSPDTKKLVIIAPLTLMPTDQSVQVIMVYDGENKKTSTLLKSFPATNRNLILLNCFLTNDGEVFMLMERIFTLEERKVGFSRYDYRFYAINPANQAIEEIPLNFDNKAIASLNYKINPDQKKIHVYGLLSNINTTFDGDYAQHLFYKTIDLTDHKVVNSGLSAFSKEIIADIKGKPVEELIEGDGISNAFNLKEILWMKDQTVALVFERYFTETSASYISVISPDQRVQTNNHYYETVLIVRLNQNNEWLNYSVIPKKQFSQNDRAYANSIMTWTNGEDIYVLFNDHSENKELRPDDISKLQPMIEPGLSSLFCVISKSDGCLTKKEIYSNRGNAKVMIPQSILATLPDQIIGLYTTSNQVKEWIPNNHIGLFSLKFSQE